MFPKLHFYLSTSPKFPDQPSVLDRWRSEVRGRGLLLQTEKLFVHFSLLILMGVNPKNYPHHVVVTVAV